jgi:hypothetical protein
MVAEVQAQGRPVTDEEGKSTGKWKVEVHYRERYICVLGKSRGR